MSDALTASRGWKRQMLTNTGTNYLRVGLRLITGVVTFRLLYQHLSSEAFGFWALLWSLFGYTVLLDFGMGTAAQKETAYHRATGNWDELSRSLSTLFYSFVGLGLILLLGLLAIEPWFLSRVHVATADLPVFSRAYCIFFVALALSFPLGLFYEVLNGLQRIDIANGLCAAGMVANVVLIVLAIRLHASFDIFVLIGVGTSVLPHVGAMYWALRLMPDVRLSPTLFKPSQVRPVLTFSAIAYLIMFRNFLLARTDQLTISWFLGVSVVALYQAGFKMTELLNSVTWQLQDCLSSVAAHLHASQDRKSLIDLLLESTRLTAMLTIVVYAFTAVHLVPLLQLLTGTKTLEPVTIQVAHLLLLAASLSLVAGGCPQRILLMCGWERPLLRLTMVEGVLKLVLSIVMVQRWGLPGLALATLLPTALVGWFGVVPLTMKFAHLTAGEWGHEVFGKVLSPVAASLVLLWLTSQVPLAGSLVLLQLVCHGLVVMAPIGIFLVTRMRHGFWSEAVTGEAVVPV